MPRPSLPTPDKQQSVLQPTLRQSKPGIALAGCSLVEHSPSFDSFLGIFGSPKIFHGGMAPPPRSSVREMPRSSLLPSVADAPEPPRTAALTRPSTQPQGVCEGPPSCSVQALDEESHDETPLFDGENPTTMFDAEIPRETDDAKMLLVDYMSDWPTALEGKVSQFIAKNKLSLDLFDLSTFDRRGIEIADPPRDRMLWPIILIFTPKPLVPGIEFTL